MPEPALTHRQEALLRYLAKHEPHPNTTTED